MPIRFLQVVLDDMSFFDATTMRLESDERLQVNNVIVVNERDYKFKCIKNYKKVTVLWNKRMVRNFFGKGEYDVVFLYTLIPQHWDLIKYIPKNKKIIWWAWGWDLYDTFLGLEPLLMIDRFKQHTIDLIGSKKDVKELFKKSIYIITKPINKARRNKALKRIDFFQPVLPIEYDMLRKFNSDFRAELFFRPIKVTQLPEAIEKKANGNILFGNSSTTTNNHLDVWEYIKRASLCDNQTLIIPLNYGDPTYGDIIQQVIETECPNANFLREMMEESEYLALMDSCSYAVFGVMRQQAMGNINRCIRRGMKLFLFRDSMNYQFLKSIGVKVFAIEDIDKMSFQEPLSLDMQMNNNRVLTDYFLYKNTVYDNVVENSFGLK